MDYADFCRVSLNDEPMMGEYLIEHERTAMTLGDALVLGCRLAHERHVRMGAQESNSYNFAMRDRLEAVVAIARDVADGYPAHKPPCPCSLCLLHAALEGIS